MGCYKEGLLRTLFAGRCSRCLASCLWWVPSRVVAEPRPFPRCIPVPGFLVAGPATVLSAMLFSSFSLALLCVLAVSSCSSVSRFLPASAGKNRKTDEQDEPARTPRDATEKLKKRIADSTAAGAAPSEPGAGMHRGTRRGLGDSTGRTHQRQEARQPEPQTENRQRHKH